MVVALPLRADAAAAASKMTMEEDFMLTKEVNGRRR